MKLPAAFASRKLHGKAFVPFIMGGDPDLDTTTELIVALAASGATAIEVGVPFSDPIADGPVIQRAAERALAQGVTLDGVLRACAAAHRRADVPLVLFTYANPLARYGIDRLAQHAPGAGISGVLITDMPVEHSMDIAERLRKAEVDLIQLAAPTSTEERLARIAAAASGFIYAVSRTGITGEQARLADDAAVLVRRLRRFTDLPVLLGFGISSAEQFRQACALADGAVIGSALVKLIAQHGRSPGLLDAVRRQVAEWTATAGAAQPV